MATKTRTYVNTNGHHIYVCDTDEVPINGVNSLTQVAPYQEVDVLVDSPLERNLKDTNGVCTKGAKEAKGVSAKRAHYLDLQAGLAPAYDPTATPPVEPSNAAAAPAGEVRPEGVSGEVKIVDGAVVSQDEVEETPAEPGPEPDEGEPDVPRETSEGDEGGGPEAQDSSSGTITSGDVPQATT